MCDQFRTFAAFVPASSSVPRRNFVPLKKNQTELIKHACCLLHMYTCMCFFRKGKCTHHTRLNVRKNGSLEASRGRVFSIVHKNRKRFLLEERTLKVVSNFRFSHSLARYQSWCLSDLLLRQQCWSSSDRTSRPWCQNIKERLPGGKEVQYC